MHFHLSFRWNKLCKWLSPKITKKIWHQQLCTHTHIVLKTIWAKEMHFKISSRDMSHTCDVRIEKCFIFHWILRNGADGRNRIRTGTQNHHIRFTYILQRETACSKGAQLWRVYILHVLLNVFSFIFGVSFSYPLPLMNICCCCCCIHKVRMNGNFLVAYSHICCLSVPYCDSRNK